LDIATPDFEHVGETVTLHGWLYNKSSKGKLHFLQVRDGSGVVQCVVFKGNVDAELFERTTLELQVDTESTDPSQLTQPFDLPAGRYDLLVW
jgi:asparaginyl-tRNA synthetase